MKISEIKLAFTKGNFKNKTVVYYEVEISDAEVEAGYEYCISVSRSNSTDPGNFFFLYLAGASETGKPSEGKALLKNLDYVYKYNGQYLPAFDENYTPNHVKLYFDFSAESDDIVFLFNMDDIQNSTNVYYYTSGPTINDEITYASVGVLESTTAKFPPRSET